MNNDRDYEEGYKEGFREGQRSNDDRLLYDPLAPQFPDGEKRRLWDEFPEPEKHPRVGMFCFLAFWAIVLVWVLLMPI